MINVERVQSDLVSLQTDNLIPEMPSGLILDIDFDELALEIGSQQDEFFDILNKKESIERYR